MAIGLLALLFVKRKLTDNGKGLEAEDAAKVVWQKRLLVLLTSDQHVHIFEVKEPVTN